jgi:hypothetical protein
MVVLFGIEPAGELMIGPAGRGVRVDHGADRVDDRDACGVLDGIRE